MEYKDKSQLNFTVTSSYLILSQDYKCYTEVFFKEGRLFPMMFRG